MRGKISGFRPLSAENESVEASYSAKGILMGVSVGEIGLFKILPKGRGIFYGEGNGLITSSEGQTVSWQGFGTGRPMMPDERPRDDVERETRDDIDNSLQPQAGNIWKGAVHFQTKSSGKFAALNHLLATFRLECSLNRIIDCKAWELK